MKDSSILSSRSPFVYFWLGILTGALIVIASFMLRSMSYDGGASVLQSPGTVRSINVPTSKGAAQSINVPTSKGAAQSINVPTSKLVR